MACRNAICCPMLNTDRAAISIIVLRTRFGRHADGSVSCSPSSRPSRRGLSSLLMHLSMVTCIHADTCSPPPITARLAQMHSGSGSRRRAPGALRDAHCIDQNRLVSSTQSQCDNTPPAATSRAAVRAADITEGDSLVSQIIHPGCRVEHAR